MRSCRTLLTLGALIVTAVLVGCGPNASPAPAKPTAPAALPVAPSAASPAPASVPGPAAAASPSPSPAATAPTPTPVVRSGEQKELILATTTSTQDSGLLDLLVPLFQQASGYQVKTISVGTGAALALGARGEADVVLVHAPAAEKQWMEQGNGTSRLLVMHNDFIIVGPEADPARLRGSGSAIDALKKLADARATFVSRGDNSGTHQLELQLWKQADLGPKGQSWYVESGSGMGQTLTIADQRQGYTISDRATWLARKAQLPLSIVVEGDPALFNVYHVMPVNPQKFPTMSLNVVGARAFADFMVAAETQRQIGEFGKDKYGQQLFIPDAGKGDEELGG